MSDDSASNRPWTSPMWWQGTIQPLTSCTGLPPAAYVDIDYFGDELDRVFGRAWVGVGVSPEIPVGRLIVRRVGPRSIVVTRTENGKLVGYLNACRHRGTELAECDRDIDNVIRCPYHRWGYRLDGTLVSAPRFDEVPRDGFDPLDFGLVPVRVDEWGGLVFACLSDQTPALDEWLGDLPQRLRGYDLSTWQLAESLDVEIDANWKLVTENYQEYYHLQWVHPELAKVSRVKDHYRYQGPGMYCGQTTTPVSADNRDDWLALPPKPGLDISDATSGRFLAIFPNIMLSVLPNHVFVMRLDPLGPGRSRETCTWLLPPETNLDGGAEVVAAFDRTKNFWLDVNNEDIDIVQRSQRGVANGVPAGPLSPRFEEPLHRFHNMVASHMTGAPLAAAIPVGDDITDPGARLGTDPNPAPPAIEMSV